MEDNSEDSHCYEIRQTRDCGRFIVATQTIEKNQVVLEDEAFCVGPFTVSSPLCLRCHISPLTLANSCQCPGGCGYLVCQECYDLPMKMPSLHQQYECNVLANAIQNGNFVAPKITDLGRPHPAYSIITPLRLLLMLKSEKKELNSDLKNKIKSLEHHTKDREKNDPSSWKIHQAFVVKPLVKMGFDDTDIQEALGKLLVNTLTIEQDSVRAMGLFPNYAMMNHDCIHNTKTFVEMENGCFKLRVIATQIIPPGTEITTRYVPFNQEKFTRRQFLLEKWQFHCQCRCCSDPSENGTYYSAIAHKCCKDEDGYLLPHVINKAEWICNKCSASITLEEGEDILKKMQKISESAFASNNNGLTSGCYSQSIDHCREVVETLSTNLHPNHCFVIKLLEKMVRLQHKTSVNQEELQKIGERIQRVRRYHEADPETCQWFKNLLPILSRR